MYIIIIGGGEVGYYLSKALLNKGHEVLVVERDLSRRELICDELGSVCVRGDGCEVATLENVGTSRADIFIAVTGDDEDNLIACQVAKYKFEVPRTIARITNPKNEALFKKLGVDVTVSSTSIILEYIEHEVPTYSITHLLTLRDKGLGIVEIKIPPESGVAGKQVKELPLPPRSRLALIIRKGQKPLVPKPGTTLQGGDQIIAVTTPETEEELSVALRGD